MTNKVEEGEEDLLGWHMIDYLKVRLTGEINRLSTLFSLLIGASDIKIIITGKFFGVVIWLFFS